MSGRRAGRAAGDGEEIVFYALRVGGGVGAGAAPLPPDPDGLTRSRWAPSLRRVRPPGATGAEWPVWWVLHHTRVLANREYGVALVHDAAGRLVHRATVVPGFFRFPFMAAGDLQIGNVWTAEEWRGRGLASASLRTIVDTAGNPAGRRFWYLTEATNTASRRLAERAGFEVVGTGRRVPRAGLRALGAFRLDAER